MTRDEWIERFTRIHEGDAEGEAYHGPASKTILRAVAPGAAMARPIAGAHTIFEIVQHVLAWRELVRSRLEGGPPRPMPDEEDWAPVEDGTAAGWAALLQRLEANHRAVLALLGSVSQETLGKLEPLLRFLVHHEIAHMGQVALLKRAGKDRP